jgi:hypothetical protein
VPICHAPTLVCHQQEREEALTRYRQKRKARQAEAAAAHEGRRQRAHGQTRVKGRFAKAGAQGRLLHSYTAPGMPAETCMYGCSWQQPLPATLHMH